MVNTRRRLHWKLLICSMLCVLAAVAQSTLTQIRDTVLNSDGTPFSGTVVITWNGFTGTDGGSGFPLSTSARIYSGALSVLLVPTTTASVGTFYQAVFYSSNGIVTWTETWQVPPSTAPLTLSTIRTSTTQTGGGSSGGTGGGGTTGGGTGGGLPGGQYATLPISIGQVTSLSGDLASINSAVATLTTQLTSLSTSVATLSSATGTNALFIDRESPAGSVDGTNSTFNLSKIPTPVSSLTVYRNGLVQSPGVDFAVNGSTITFLPGSVPKATDNLAAFYRIPGAGPIATFTDSENPGGVIDGTNLVFTLAAVPSPAPSLKLYKNGVLLAQNLDYTLNAGVITFISASLTPQPGDSLQASYRH